MNKEQVRSKILAGSLVTLKTRGARFTMDELARYLSMSKKTIYRIFPDKESILADLVDDVFDRVAREQEMILCDRNLSTLGKLEGIFCVLPAEARGINFADLFCYRGKYPKPYERIEARIESNWEPTFRLIHEGINEGSIRPVNPHVIKIIYESAIESLLYGRNLAEMDLDYNEALEEMAAVIIHGIRNEERQAGGGNGGSFQKDLRQ